MPISIVRLIRGIKSTAPLSKRTISFISCSFGETHLFGVRAVSACKNKRKNFIRLKMAVIPYNFKFCLTTTSGMKNENIYLTSDSSELTLDFFIKSSSASLSIKQALVLTISGISTYP